MNKREFNKHLNACRTKKTLDRGKLNDLPEETKTAMAMHIIKYRGPILSELVTPTIDRKWLACSGYLHTTESPSGQGTFIHTREHRIR